MKKKNYNQLVNRFTEEFRCNIHQLGPYLSGDGAGFLLMMKMYSGKQNQYTLTELEKMTGIPATQIDNLQFALEMHIKSGGLKKTGSNYSSSYELVNSGKWIFQDVEKQTGKTIDSFLNKYKY